MKLNVCFRDRNRDRYNSRTEEIFYIFVYIVNSLHVQNPRHAHFPELCEVS